MFYKFFIIYIPNTTMENIMKTWKKWFKNYKNKSIEDFASFINRTGIGDMDLDTFCRYKYFMYLFGEKLSYDYKSWDKMGVKPCDIFETEEDFTLSLFCLTEDIDDPDDFNQMDWNIPKE